MANPQPTDAHLRMAHSIGEAIMMRDFSKHQRKILDLILRLSWGCGKKFAYIPQQKDFKIVGIFEGDVKKDLEWLEVSKIICREDCYYWFNKNFDEWQISRVNPFDPQRLSELLSANLNNTKPELSVLLSSYPKLSVLLSNDFGKHEPIGSENTKSATPTLASSKEILKKDINNSIDIEEVIKNFDGTFDEQKTIIRGQSLWKVRRILAGEMEALEANKRVYRDCLVRLGIPVGKE